MPESSDYIVYVDESGDRSLDSMNKHYPVFVLAFCVFHKEQYVTQASPEIQRLKFKYFGHDMVVLHEHDLRKETGPFKIMFDQMLREQFTSDLTQIIATTDFSVIATYVRKDEYRKKHGSSHNLYDVAVRSCLKRLHQFLLPLGQTEKLTHVVFEARGKQEDKDLELEFRRICDQETPLGVPMPFDIQIAHKQINSCGLQFADLIARPIGRKQLKPEQANRAFDVLAKKFFRGEEGQHNEWGLKCFP